MTMKRIILALLTLFPFVATAQEIEETDASDQVENAESADAEQPRILLNRYRIGNGLRFSARGGAKLTVSGLVQTTFETRRYEGVDKNYSRFRVRRARLRFDGSAAHDKIRYRLGMEFVRGSESDSEDGSLLWDAWVAYRPWGNKLQITFGQAATPTDNLELSMSSQTLQFVERSKLTGAFSTIRELGLFLSSSLRVGSEGYIRPQVAITDGSGPLTGGGRRYGGLKYGARVTYLPFGTFRSMGGNRESDMAYELTPKLAVGVGYSYADGVSDRRGGRSNGDILYRDAEGRIDLPDYAKLTANVHFKYRGFSLLGEFVKTWGYVPSSIASRVRNDGSSATTFPIDDRDDKEAYILNRMNVGWGYNIQGGYMLRSLWEFALRYTRLCPDRYSYLNNNLYNNRHHFYDIAISKYLLRNYAAKIQFTAGLARTHGDCRTPDGNVFSGNEWTANILFQFKF